MELTLLLLPIIIALFLSLKLLFFPKNKMLEFKILGFFFLLFTMVLFAILMQYQKQFYPKINEYIIPISVILYISIISLPPTVYFYVASLTDHIKKYNSSEKIIPHYIFTIILLVINIFSIVYFQLEDNHNEAAYKLCQQVWNFSNFGALLFVFPLLNVFHLYKSFKIYINHRKQVEEVFSYDQDVSLKWMLIFLLGYISFIISFYVLDQESSPIVVYIPLVLYLVFIGFRGNKQHRVRFTTTEEDATLEEVITETETEADLKKREELKAHLVTYMETETPYTNNQLTIYQLAKMLGTNSSYLSVLLNKDFEMNFTSFINSYRIEKSKEILKSPTYNNYTIEAIGHMAGFKSKSAFNRWFKIMTNSTPSNYRKQFL